MPVDLSLPNSILQAFTTGLQIKRQKEQDIADEQFRQQQLQERMKEFEAQQKQQQTQFEAEHQIRKAMLDLQTAQQRENIRKGNVEQFQTTGAAPEGYYPTKVRRNDQGYRLVTYANAPEGTEGYQSFEAMSPEDHIRMLEAQRAAELRPQQQFTESQAEAQRVAAAALKTQELTSEEKRATEARTSAEKIEAGREATQRYIAELAAGSREKVASMKSGMNKLSAAQQGEVQQLISVRNNAKTVLDMLDKPEYKDYFNRSGSLTEAAQKKLQDMGVSARGGQPTSDYDVLSTALGKLQQSNAVADFGKVIPKTEKDIMSGYIPGPQHNQTLNNVKEKTKALMDRADATINLVTKLANDPNVSPEDIASLVANTDVTAKQQTGHTGMATSNAGFARPTQAQSNMVRVTLKNGKSGQIPRSKLNQFLAENPGASANE